MKAAVISRIPVLASTGWNSWDNGWVYLAFAALLLMVVLGSWTGAIAARKNRNMQLWFIIGMFLPVVGLFLIYLLGPAPE